MADLDGLDEPLRRLLERIAAPAALEVPDLPAIGAALVDLAADADWCASRVTLLGATSGLLRLHAPARGPRLALAHRLEGQMGAVHDHGTWVALAAISGLETHRRYRRPGPDGRLEIAEVTGIGPTQVATLLPPDDIHDHGHLFGHGAPAYVLILTGDDQFRHVRTEWDPATGRHRTLQPGDAGRWLASEPWPEG